MLKSFHHEIRRAKGIKENNYYKSKAEINSEMQRARL